LPIQYDEAHKCVERAAECDCPICGTYMFNSAETIVALPCGHYQHQTCYNEYMEVAYQCPVCKKSAVNMELHWRKLEDEIARQPMPSKWRGTIVEIRCNDCGGKSRCDYHWLGNRCGLCDSFNTVEMRIIKTDVVDDGERPAASPRAERTGRHVVPQARARSYFSDPDEGGDGVGAQGDAAEGELAFGFGNTAYEMLARMSRSLSPLRHYFEAEGEEGVRLGPRGGPATEAEIEDLGFWSDATGQRSEGGSDDDDGEDGSEEGSEEGSESEDEEEEEDDDSDDDSDGSLLNLTLIGHR
jgi:Zinc-ribbon/Ring finger domain